MGIIGRPFSKWMKEQVEVRQRVLGSGFNGNKRNFNNSLPDSQSPFLNSSPWIRMVSSINLATFTDKQREESSVPKSTKTVLQKLEEKSEFASFIDNFKGEGLAKNFVLFNGVTPRNGSMYSGITKEDSATSSNIFGGAYGFGDLETIQDGQGFVPQPGITSVDFKYQNDGALSKATVSIKAFSKFQFQIIDILFQRPGYTVLLEFGHSIFLDNEGNTQYAGEGEYTSTRPFELMFEGPLPQYKLAAAILKEKTKWRGNYEGNFMKIVKWNWSFNTDGTYDITVSLVGVGDVINSLKANVSPSERLEMKAADEKSLSEEDIKDAAEDGIVIVAEAVKSKLNYALYEIYHKAQIEAKTASTNWVNAIGNFISNLTSWFADLKAGDYIVQNFPLPEFKMLKENGELGSYNPETDQNSPNKIFTGFKQAKGKDEVKGLKIPGAMCMIKNADTNIDSDYNPQTFITFGTLIALITVNCSLVDSNNNPLTYFNFNFDDLNQDSSCEFKTFKGQFSSDPNICLIPPTIIEKSTSEGAYERQKDNDDMDLMKGIKEHKDALAKFLTDEPGKGRLANVYIDINYIAKTLKSNTDEDKKECSIVDFLNAILSGINGATGGVNEFRVMFNENSHMIEITNQVPFDDEKEQQNDEVPLTVINTFGLRPGQGSFVTDIKLNAELTNDYATIISVGAQSNGNQQGTNSGAFSLYNYGLIDRIIPVKKLSKKTDEVKDPPDSGTDDVEEIKDPIGRIWSEEVQDVFDDVYEDFNFTTENTSTLGNINADYSQMVLGEAAAGKNSEDGKATQPASFFLPFNLGLTFHGLSGFKIFQAFQTDGNVLPCSYDPDTIQQIIKSYSHKVDLDGWTTSIETIGKALFGKLSTIEENPVRDNNTAGSGNESQDSSVPGDDGTLPDDPNGTITSGFPLNKIYYDGPTNKTQIYLHHTAGATKSPKITVSMWNKRTDHVATHYITNNLGDKEQLFKDEAWANHLGLPSSTFRKFGVRYQPLDKISLGIEMQSYGYADLRNGKYITAYGNSIPANTVGTPIDKNGRPTTYKGHKYYQKYNSQHIANVKDILVGWMNKYGIPFKFDYDVLFTQNKIPFTGKPGIYTHNSVRTDKYDVWPQKELIDMLKSISS